MWLYGYVAMWLSFKLFKFPNSDSELKGSTSGQKIGPEDTVQGLPATPVPEIRRARFCCYLHELVTPTLKNTS